MKRVSNGMRFVGILSSSFWLVIGITCFYGGVVSSSLSVFVAGSLLFLLSALPFYCLLKDWAAEVNWSKYNIVRLYRDFKELRKKKKMGLLD